MRRQKLEEILLSDLIQDIFVPLVMIVLLIILTNPLGLSYSSALIGAIVFALVLTFAVSIVLYRHEDGYFPDRAAFFAVAAVLVAGIVIQSLLNVLDVWLALALVALIGGKVWGKIYSQFRG